MTMNPPKIPGGSMPWETEGNFFHWREASTGLKCFIVRNDIAWTLCGYVQVKRDHPLYGVRTYNPHRRVPDPESCLGTSFEPIYRPDLKSPRKLWHLDVHGGVTFAGRFKTNHYMRRHWYIGFDTSHAGDLSPGLDAQLAKVGYVSQFPRDDVYRDLKYVRTCTEELAMQLGRMR